MSDWWSRGRYASGKGLDDVGSENNNNITIMLLSYPHMCRGDHYDRWNNNNKLYFKTIRCALVCYMRFSAHERDHAAMKRVSSVVVATVGRGKFFFWHLVETSTCAVIYCMLYNNNTLYTPTCTRLFSKMWHVAFTAKSPRASTDFSALPAAEGIILLSLPLWRVAVAIPPVSFIRQPIRVKAIIPHTV